VLVDEIDHSVVLFLRPGTLDEPWTEHLLPAVQTLYVCTTHKNLRNSLPVPTPILLHCIAKQLVLFSIPLAS
jgi:hypothetical protein